MLTRKPQLGARALHLSIAFAILILARVRFVHAVLSFWFAWKGSCEREKNYFLRWSEVFCMHLHRDKGSDLALHLRVLTCHSRSHGGCDFTELHIELIVYAHTLDYIRTVFEFLQFCRTCVLRSSTASAGRSRFGTAPMATSSAPANGQNPPLERRVWFSGVVFLTACPSPRSRRFPAAFSSPPLSLGL